MQRELVLEADKSVVEGMGRAFEAMLDEAKRQAKSAVESPATAVHDYRRAIRRAESVALLARPLMRKPQRGWIGEALTRARRRTRVLRDLDAVVPVMGRLKELELGDDEALIALAAWLDEARGEVASDELVAWRLRKNARSLAGLGEIFAVGLHAWADLDLVTESLRESYRRVRKAYAQADKSRELDDVHAWRRATRALRYQLELMSSRADLPMAAGLSEAHAIFKSMVKELGQVTDLIAMRGLVDEARETVVGVELKGLSRALSDLIASRLERVFAEAALTFSLKPRDFLALEAKVDIADEPEAKGEDEAKAAGGAEAVGEAAGESAATPETKVEAEAKAEGPADAT